MWLFQSHAGSIEARRGAALPEEGVRRFNPTLVRLRQPSQKPLSRLNQPFQSHAGSIEARIAVEQLGGRLDGFNPTLVRLRPKPPVIPARCAVQFQSHAGSIEASKPKLAGSSPARVSIPRWFD